MTGWPLVCCWVWLQLQPATALGLRRCWEGYRSPAVGAGLLASLVLGRGEIVR